MSVAAISRHTQTQGPTPCGDSAGTAAFAAESAAGRNRGVPGRGGHQHQSEDRLYVDAAPFGEVVKV